jgi:hypothetical protein
MQTLIFLLTVAAILWMGSVALAVFGGRGAAKATLKKTTSKHEPLQFRAVCLQFLATTLLASSITFTTIFESPFVALAVIGWPLFAPMLVLQAVHKFPSALGLPSLIAGCIAALAVTLVHKFVRTRLSHLWPSIAVLTAFSIFILTGEILFHAKLKGAAEKLSPECLDAGSFRHSLAIAGTDFQFALHAGAIKNGIVYGWSHREGKFYIVPENAKRNVLAPSNAWLSLPYPSCHHKN